MRSIFCSLMLFVFSGLYAQQVNPYSSHRLDRFYNLFLEEERGLLDAHGMSNGGHPYNPGDLSPPPNPPAPDSFKDGYLPFVIVNNSNFSDNEVFFTIDSTASGTVFVDINGGVGSLVTLTDGDNNNSYVYALSSLPKSSNGTYVVYIPEITSGRLWISYGSNAPLLMDVISSGLQEPSALPGTAAYNYVFDKMEFTFQKSIDPPIFVNATAVDYFSIPIYNYLQGATSANSNNGLYQKSSWIFNYVKGVFASTAASNTLSQWNNLVFSSTNTSQILRICNPAKAMSQYVSGNSGPTIFDNTYLENSSYNFNYLSDIWTGSGGYYTSKNLTIQSGSHTFQGQVSGNDIVLNGINGTTGTITFTNPNALPGDPPVNTWSYQTFANVNSGVSQSGGIDPNVVDNILNLFQEGIAVGLVPTTDTISASYFSANRSNYFQNNAALGTSGTGPWYSLYGKALLSLGNIYVFSVNEDLLPDVQVSGPYNSNSTYVGITLGKF